MTMTKRNQPGEECFMTLHHLEESTGTETLKRAEKSHEEWKIQLADVHCAQLLKEKKMFITNLPFIITG